MRWGDEDGKMASLDSIFSRIFKPIPLSRISSLLRTARTSMLYFNPVSISLDESKFELMTQFHPWDLQQPQPDFLISRAEQGAYLSTIVIRNIVFPVFTAVVGISAILLCCRTVVKVYMAQQRNPRTDIIYL